MPLESAGTLDAGTRNSHTHAAAKAPDGSEAPPNPSPVSSFISAEHEAEYRAFVEKHPDIEAVEFLLVDPNGVMRGKWGPGDALKKAFQE
ncbi:MAG: hypothetical protein WAU16_17865, partial [Rhizobiaceae bacterium]